MELSRPHRHSRRYPAGVLDRAGGLNGNGGSPGIRQSRPRVSKVFAPERYSAGVPPCQFAGALTECLEVRASANTGFSAQAAPPRAVPRHQSAGALGEYLQPSDLADNGISGRPRTRGLPTPFGECRQASRAIPGFAEGQRLIESPVPAAAVTRCGYKIAESDLPANVWSGGRSADRAKAVAARRVQGDTPRRTRSRVRQPSGRYSGRVSNQPAGRSATDADRLGPTGSGRRSDGVPELAATGHNAGAGPACSRAGMPGVLARDGIPGGMAQR